MGERQAFAYILANRKRGTLYTGVTTNLRTRLYHHRAKTYGKSFSAKYDVHKLVWFQEGPDVVAAIALEKKIKNRSRAWKIRLIVQMNPDWQDLSEPRPRTNGQGRP